MNGQTLEHPEGRTRDPQYCPRCGRFGNLQYHVIMGNKYQFSKYLCAHEETKTIEDPDPKQANHEKIERCGEFLVQLEEENNATT